LLEDLQHLGLCRLVTYVSVTFSTASTCHLEVNEWALRALVLPGGEHQVLVGLALRFDLAAPLVVSGVSILDGLGNTVSAGALSIEELVEPWSKLAPNSLDRSARWAVVAGSTSCRIKSEVSDSIIRASQILCELVPAEASSEGRLCCDPIATSYLGDPVCSSTERYSACAINDLFISWRAVRGVALLGLILCTVLALALGGHE
jgi:hypothetical protein